MKLRRLGALIGLSFRAHLRQPVGWVTAALSLVLLLVASPLVLFEFDRGSALLFEAQVSLLWTLPILIAFLTHRRSRVESRSQVFLSTRGISAEEITGSSILGCFMSSVLLSLPSLALAVLLLPSPGEIGPPWDGLRVGWAFSQWFGHLGLVAAVVVLTTNEKPAVSGAWMSLLLLGFVRPAGGGHLLWSLLPDFGRSFLLVTGEDSLQSSEWEPMFLAFQVGSWWLIAVAVRGLIAKRSAR